MRRSPDRPHIATPGAALVAAVLLVLAGCSPVTRHQVLTFFFTGVPPLEGEEPAAAEPQPVPPSAPVRVGLPPREAMFWVHGPYANHDCDQCHVPGQPGKSRFPGEPSARLCEGCHAGFVAALDPAGTRWVHGPVASGNCTACHNPHRSPNRFMLKAEPEALCKGCHATLTVQRVAAHREGNGACLDCHDPHAGESRALPARKPAG